MKGGRVRNLDALRAVAVALTMGHHWWQVAAPTSANPIVQFFRKAGWAGVDLFFVMSGLLVAGLLFREIERYGSVRAGDFLIRRGFRIYPGYYVFLAVSVFYLPWIHWPTSAHRLTDEALFIQNYAGRVWNHTWSLAIEEHFYLLLALSFLALAPWLRRLSISRAAMCYAGVAIACCASRWATYHADGYVWARIYTRTHQRVDELLLGVLLAYVLQSSGDRIVAGPGEGAGRFCSCRWVSHRRRCGCGRIRSRCARGDWW
ncbi:MAG TPA: acyltransferase [Vicinamibacterales bacterium]|jgi:peptidoglycan/LPS O-acetylase OafA/YrhL|nr:acyltransferase [Vicinamibacterales bacterium]